MTRPTPTKRQRRLAIALCVLMPCWALLITRVVDPVVFLPFSLLYFGLAWCFVRESWRASRTEQERTSS